MTTLMTRFYPWVGYQVNEQVSVWGVTGYGTGMLSLTPGSAAALETGVSMAMTAVGTRGELIGSRTTGGFALAFKADALWVAVGSELLDGRNGRDRSTARDPLPAVRRKHRPQHLDRLPPRNGKR